MRQARTGFAQVLAVLAFIAIAVRAVVPSGFMVAPVDNGRFVSIVWCSGHQGLLNLDTGQVVDPSDLPLSDDSGDGAGDNPCVFAVAAQLATPQIVQVIPTPPPLLDQPAHALITITPGRGLAAPPPWATGPPTI